MPRMPSHHTTNSISDAYEVLCLLRGKHGQIIEKETSVKEPTKIPDLLHFAVRPDGLIKNKINTTIIGRALENKINTWRWRNIFSSHMSFCLHPDVRITRVHAKW